MWCCHWCTSKWVEPIVYPSLTSTLNLFLSLLCHPVSESVNYYATLVILQHSYLLLYPCQAQRHRFCLRFS
ncbi:uncharacterized protein HD556DRAFT_1364878 [Suillus plorans]|uniref:Uncharacterized protein n=1 Tax=Suillus plorans TaxID=116603 RepID=A0A9P7AS27_9AGAM|nr:uncharacterized protein HD556DRAFT_1364878 [Suillus plorans]KAG1795355.1 hypothetical protein HD556DRAFT_1364878 [Suillus plorans]